MEILRIRGAIAVILVCLWMVSCVTTPAYMATRIACAEARGDFGVADRDGEGGLTDLSRDISIDTSMRMLAGRKLRFFEQQMAGPVATSLDYRQGADSAAFVRLTTVSSRPSACLSSHGKFRYGGLYDLYLEGLQTNECVQASSVAEHSGRFVLRKQQSIELGAGITKHQLADQASTIETSTITSAQSRRAPGTYGGALLDDISPALETQCQADPQSIATAFRAAPRSDGTQPLPAVKRLVKTEADHNLLFVRSSRSEVDLRAMAAQPRLQPLVIASKRYRTLVLRDLQFVGHWDLDAWSGCVPTLMPLEDAVLALSWEPGGLHISAFSLDGNVRRTFAAKVDDGAYSLTSDGGCGNVQAAALNGRLYVLGYPESGGKASASGGVFEAHLADLGAN